MQIKINKNDIKRLSGRFVIQVTDLDDVEIMANGLTSKIDFWAEKRISFVSFSDRGVNLAGFFYTHGDFTIDEFVERINGDGNKNDDRHFRFLTSSEMSELTKWMQKR